VVSEKNVGEGVAAFFAGVELLDEGGGGVGDPVFGYGLSGAEDDYGGGCRVYYGAQEGAHCADEAEVRDVDVLARGGVEALPEFLLVTRPGADYYYGHVCGFCGGDGFGESALVVGPALTALCVRDGAIANSVLDTCERSL
jgi:hypothetical protein